MSLPEDKFIWTKIKILTIYRIIRAQEIIYLSAMNQLARVYPHRNQNESLSTLKRRAKGSISSKFRKVTLQTNKYRVDVSKLSQLCIFVIKFMPQIKEDFKALKMEILEKVMPQIREFIDDPIVKEGLIFSHKIPRCKDKTIIFENYIIMIREVQRFDAKENPQMLLYFLGNVMKKVMEKMQYIEVSNSNKFINMGESKQIQNLFVFSGFKMHFEMLQNGYFLTVDTTKKIIRNESVLEYINVLYKQNSSMERDEKRQFVRKALFHRIVMTNYGKSRYLRIQDIIYVDLKQVIVESYKMTLPEYYKEKYNIEIKNLKQPLLLTNSKKKQIKTYLVPELCLMTGIPDDLDEFKRKLISDFSKVTCGERKNAIDSFIKRMKKEHGDEVFPVLGIDISGNSQKIEAKIIPPPTITFGGGRKACSGREASFQMYDNPILKAKTNVKLGVITFSGVDQSGLVNYFRNSFRNLKAPIEMIVIKANNSNQGKNLDSVEKLIEKAKNSENCTICLVIIPNNLSQNYKKIKQICLMQNQIVCQVMLQKTLKNKNILSVALKIYLQILAKTGSTLWAAVPQSTQKGIMFVAYYDCEIPKNRPDAYTMSMCCTYDDIYSQMFSKSKKYAKEHEQIQCMRELLMEGISAYKMKNGCLPEDIVILENQKTIKSQEQIIQFFIEPTLESCKKLYKNKTMKITHIIVKKGLNDRFFKQSQGKISNPPIGTLIDQVVSASANDFYMLAHTICTKNSSIIPLNYKIIFSNSDIDVGIIHSLLFSQCFSYPNFTGAIRKPALLQSATKCSKFIAEVLNNKSLVDSLCFLPYYI